MAYNLEAREFNILQRSADLSKACGEVIGDLLGDLTISTNPYKPVADVVPTVYTITLDVQEVSTGTPSTVNYTFNSTGAETYTELLTAMVLEGNTNFGTELFYEAHTAYTNDEDMYLTVVSKEGYRITSAPIVANIIIETSTTVQGSIGSPSCYTAYQEIVSPRYPLLIVTPMPVTAVSDNWKTGSVELDLGSGLRYYPYYESYIKMNCKLTVESGRYEDIISGSMLDAESILRRLKFRLQEENKNQAFLNRIDATLNRNWTITPSPSVESTNWMSTAGTTFTLDIIDRYVEVDGDIMTKVTFTGAQVNTETLDDDKIEMDYSVQRTDHVDQTPP